MKNTGKQFEDDIKKSVPHEVLLYRLPDAAQSFGGGNKLRFSLKNPFDFLAWDSRSHRLFALEMKTVSGISISFEREPGQSGVIHYHQIQGLKDWNQYDGITCGFIIEFRKIATTVFLDIAEFENLIARIDKKSISFRDITELQIPHIIIPQRKLRTRYRYDLDALLKDSAYKTEEAHVLTFGDA